MRLVDALLRHGHLSDRALIDAIMTGERPGHLDRCGLCAERLVDTSRWLDGVRTAAIEAADAVFPPERLAAQQAQISRRIEQLDEPTRVIAFPRQTQPDRRDFDRRRVAPAWIGVAAAAGLVVGAVGGQLTARLDQPAVAEIPAVAPVTLEEPPVPESVSIPIDDMDAFMPEPLVAMNEVTPRVVSYVAED
jgi:hypothetical protein